MDIKINDIVKIIKSPFLNHNYLIGEIGFVEKFDLINDKCYAYVQTFNGGAGSSPLDSLMVLNDPAFEATRNKFIQEREESRRVLAEEYERTIKNYEDTLNKLSSEYHLTKDALLDIYRRIFIVLN